MNKVNFDREMHKILLKYKESGEKKKLLLHSCCAPCSSACIEKLIDYVDITLYFYNPNMDSEKEYNLRAKEQQRLCKELGVSCIVEEYCPQSFNNAVSGLEKEREGGSRCEKCFRLRLEKTAKHALDNGFDLFATTLTVSPLKNAQIINGVGINIQDNLGMEYLPTDFKKGNGYLRSIELSKKYGLYRQNYCGCIHSKNASSNLVDKV